MGTKDVEQKIIERLINSIEPDKGALTLADASTKSGLSFMDAKLALNHLIFEYRGNLSVTDQGEILYSFPYGFKKPWAAKEKFDEFFLKVKNGIVGVLKFLVRAWISIVMVGYVAIFAVILIALTISKSSDREDNHSLSGSLMFHTLIRLVLDSLFWTFHPFSPFRIYEDDYYSARMPARAKRMPFYERVNRFFFGPTEKPTDVNDLIKLVLQEIRAKKGRIGIFDVIRVTGLSKEEADPFMASLMLKYDGEVMVSDEGGIFYEFASLRKSVYEEASFQVAPIWQSKEKVPEFTGNTFSSNVLIFSLNAFNLIMSSIAISSSWTLERLKYILFVASQNVPAKLLPPPPEGTPLILGWIPFLFSVGLFFIPLARLFNRPRKKEQVFEKNGRRGLIKVILSKLKGNGIKEEALKEAWVEQASAIPKDRVFVRTVIKLGGELELNDKDEPVYRFKALEAEMRALESARKKASVSEKNIGEVIYSSAQ